MNLDEARIILSLMVVSFLGGVAAGWKFFSGDDARRPAATVPAASPAARPSPPSSSAEGSSSSKAKTKVTVRIPVDALGGGDPGRKGEKPPSPGPEKFVDIQLETELQASSDARASATAPLPVPPAMAAAPAPRPFSDLTDRTRWGVEAGLFDGHVALSYQALRQEALGTSFCLGLQANHLQAGAGVYAGGPVYVGGGLSRNHFDGSVRPYAAAGLRLQF